VTPEMIPTPESSSIEEIGYDADAEEVYVRYRPGGLYAYLGVPGVVWEELLAAPSKGTYVNEVIKGYPYRRE
jgi:KTSC domain